jgi:transglutaminase-like putative cysteine protease
VSWRIRVVHETDKEPADAVLAACCWVRSHLTYQAGTTGVHTSAIEAWTGGWWGYDPTNDMPIAHRHVLVAVGRDYADVPPLKGVYSGGKAAALAVNVDMTRLA